MTELKFLGAAILLIGFVYFILIRAINTKNYIRKSFYLLISGIIITLFFVGGIVYDIIKGVFTSYMYSLTYYMFLIVAIAFMIIVPLIYFIKGYNRKQRFKNKIKKEKVVPTIKDKKEFVYIIITYEKSFYLEKIIQKDTEIYKGITLKFKHNDFFHDEIIKEYIAKNNLEIESYKYIGKAIKSEKKDDVYYCYKINLNSLPSNYDSFELVDMYKLLTVNLAEDDKKILFTSVIEDDFTIML